MTEPVAGPSVVGLRVVAGAAVDGVPDDPEVPLVGGCDRDVGGVGNRVLETSLVSGIVLDGGIVLVGGIVLLGGTVLDDGAGLDDGTVMAGGRSSADGIPAAVVPVGTVVGMLCAGLADCVELQPAARTASSTTATARLARTAAG